MTETIEETTVGDLAGHTVAMASMVFEGEFPLPDGGTGSGLACILVSPEGSQWVGRGSEVVFGRLRWRVVELHKLPGQNGWVRLQTVP